MSEWTATAPSTRSATTAGQGRSFTLTATTAEAPAPSPVRRRIERSTPTILGGDRNTGAENPIRCNVAPITRTALAKSRAVERSGEWADDIRTTLPEGCHSHSLTSFSWTTSRRRVASTQLRSARSVFFAVPPSQWYSIAIRFLHLSPTSAMHSITSPPESPHSIPLCSSAKACSPRCSAARSTSKKKKSSGGVSPPRSAPLPTAQLNCSRAGGEPLIRQLSSMSRLHGLAKSQTVLVIF